MLNLINIIKNITLLVAILITLKIIWIAGYLYLQVPIGVIFKLLHVNEKTAYLYLWQYLPMNLENMNISANQITMISLPSIHLLLMQTVIISWLCYFFMKKREKVYFFIPTKIDWSNKKNLSTLSILFITLSLYCYCLIDIVTLTYNNNEILDLLKETYFLTILQVLIGYNILIHGMVLFLICQSASWSLFKKIIISLVLILLCTGYCYSLNVALLWKNGGISVVLNTLVQNEQGAYLTEAIHELYHYYGLNLSFCNPDTLNPCLEIKKQMELACKANNFLNQFPLYGRGLPSNLFGQIIAPTGADYYTGCSKLQGLLQNCMDTYMQDNFVKNWNLRHNPVISYHVPREPFIIKFPKL